MTRRPTVTLNEVKGLLPSELPSLGCLAEFTPSDGRFFAEFILSQ